MKTKITFMGALKLGVYAAVSAAIINGILFTIFHALGIITDDVFIQPNMPMTLFPIIFSSVLPTIIASIVYFLIDKYTSNGYKIFRAVAIILLFVSFVNPFMGIPGISIAYGVALNFMHVVVVACLLYFIQRSTKE